MLLFLLLLVFTYQYGMVFNYQCTFPDSGLLAIILLLLLPFNSEWFVNVWILFFIGILLFTWSFSLMWISLQHNTFQVVYAANGTEWYSFNIYYAGEMLYESGQPFIGMIENGLIRGFSENPDGTPLLRPDETLVYKTNSGEFSLWKPFPFKITPQLISCLLCLNLCK